MGPLMDRFSYDDTQGFRVTYDVGLSPATTNNPSKATFSFWIYTNNPKWGMRSAAEKYYALNPDSFTTSATVLGAWALDNTKPLSSVPNPEDFGWGYEEGNGDLAFDNANGIIGTHYISFPEWDINISGYSSQPPYDVLVDTLMSCPRARAGRRWTAFPRPTWPPRWSLLPPTTRTASISSATTPTTGTAIGSRCTPSLLTRRCPAAPTRCACSTASTIRSPPPNPTATLSEGIFLDNTTSVFGNIENYRKSLWAYNNGPLSFSYRTGETVQYVGDSMDDFTGALRSYLNDQGMILMASITPGSYVWFAPNIDVVGGEVPGAETLDRAYARRTLGYGKVWTQSLRPGARPPRPRPRSSPTSGRPCCSATSRASTAPTGTTPPSTSATAASSSSTCR